MGSWPCVTKVELILNDLAWVRKQGAFQSTPLADEHAICRKQSHSALLNGILKHVRCVSWIKQVKVKGKCYSGTEYSSH